MKCWQCAAELAPFAYGKVPFRAECDKCQAAIHCCKNCKYYKIGLPNDCAVPNTPYISDRLAANLCEEYKPLESAGEKKIDPDQVAKRLFGDDSSVKPAKDPKNRFNALFDD